MVIGHPLNGQNGISFSVGTTPSGTIFPISDAGRSNNFQYVIKPLPPPPRAFGACRGRGGKGHIR